MNTDNLTDGPADSANDPNPLFPTDGQSYHFPLYSEHQLISLPNSNTITFHSDCSKEIMRITPDGRLEKGAGMSDDEVSLKLFDICKNTFNAKMKELETCNRIGAERLEHMKEQLAAERARNEKLVRGIRSILPAPPYHPLVEPEWIYLSKLISEEGAAQ